MNQYLWTAVAAFVIGGAVRALKSDLFPVDIPKRALPWIALALGGASAALDARVNGVGWEEALASGVVATSIAVFGHDALRAVPGVTKVLGVLLLVGALGSAVGACTPDARRALMEQGFDTLRCALANKDLPNDQLVVYCAIQTVDVDRILRIVGEAREAEAAAAMQAEIRGRVEGERAASSARPLCPEDAAAPPPDGAAN